MLGAVARAACPTAGPSSRCAPVPGFRAHYPCGHRGVHAHRDSVARRAAVVSSSQATGADGAILLSETTAASTIPKSSVWELDFCSRPILDDRKKKVWELLICDADRSFEYALFLPNSRINSTSLKEAIEAVLAQPGAVRPEKIKYFRGQMQTIISRALGDLGIKAVPSRRCLSIMGMVEERARTIYCNMEGYDPTAATLFTLDPGAPKDLPDALRGEQWAFVQLPLSAVLKELEAAGRADIFGSSLDLVASGVRATLDRGEDPVLPGVCVFSRRAAPLAGWTNGLEVARLQADCDRACLILETGVADQWRYGQFPRTPQAREEAEAWNQAKAQLGGLHFLAIQRDPEDEEIAGIWLLLDRPAPVV